jgi:hypothetical protein
MLRTASALVLVSLSACAAGEVPLTPGAPVDAGPRVDAPRDTGARPDVTARPDAPAARDVTVAPDATVTPDAPAPPDAAVTPDATVTPDVWIFDAPAAPDATVAPDVPRDTAPVSLGDAWDPPRDSFDPVARDTDITLGAAPADASGRFGGAEDTARAPAVVYPGDGVIMPPNLTGFEIHFRPGTGNDLFEVTLQGDRGRLRLYTPCAAVGGGCAVALDERAYGELARVAQPSGAVTLSIRGTSASAGGRFGRSASRTLTVTNTDVRGGLYYWNAASGSILRFEFGRAGARPESYLRGDPINCMGCHVLSRDGSRATVGRFIPGPAITRVYDVASRATLSGDFGANFGTFSPDNARLLTSDGARFTLRDGATFATVAGLPPDNRGSMPDWSRDGRTVVFSRQRSGLALFGAPGHGAPGDLLLMRWTGAAFAAPTALVTAGSAENNYYPSFAPDDQWIVFNRSGGDSYNVIDAHLWATRASGGAPVRLAAADESGDLGNSWPKFAPFLQRWQGDPILWVTFSSRRDYGLRLQQQSRAAEMRTAQLWMAAFRPNRAGDPSATAFWLPFQDLASGNHIGQWAQQVQRMGCRSDADCNPQERCLPVGLSSATYGCVAR